MCELCGFEEVMEKIDEMLTDEKYDHATNTLSNLYDWIERHEHCTEAQSALVENIEEGTARREQGGWWDDDH